MNGVWRGTVAEIGGRPYLSTAIPLISHRDSEADWLAARRKGIGASEIASVCGVPGAFSSPFALWWAKRLGWDTERSFAMKVGSMLEPLIGELFADEHPGVRLVRPGARLYQHPKYPWMLASPDFLAIEDCQVCSTTGWVIDAPCPNCGGLGYWIKPVEAKSDQGKDWKGEPPPKHQMQLWQQMLVFGNAPGGWLIRLNGKRLSAYEIDPDQGAADLIIHDGTLFADSLRTGLAPDVDGTEATSDALKRLYPPVAEDDPRADMQLGDDLIDEFRDAYEARADANARFAVARNRIRAMIGDSHWVRDGRGERVIEHRKYKKDGYTVGTHEVDEIRKAW